MENSKKIGDEKLAEKVIEAFKDFDELTEKECSDIGLDEQHCSALTTALKYEGLFYTKDVFLLQDKSFSNKFISALTGTDGSKILWEKAEWLWEHGLSDNSFEVRVKACEELGHIGGASHDFPLKLPIYLYSLKYLIKALKDESPEVRIAAAKAIGRVRHNSMDAIPALVEVLENDENASVRESAAHAIGRIGLVEKGVIPALTKALEDKSVAVRKSAASALTCLNFVTKDALPALKKTLKNDGDEWVRAYAAAAIGKVGDPSAVPALINALKKDPFGRVREYAAESLGMLGPAAKAAVPALIKTAKGDDFQFARYEAIKALGSIGPAAKSALTILKSIKECDFDTYAICEAAKNAIEKIEVD